ncbi:S41 family peptidase [Phenylobacterium sp.]|uniref:S41 family peptidase n=1 Tax=Phenylobacterium sp. TaxID=1871053 RepID=UPI002F422D10
MKIWRMAMAAGALAAALVAGAVQAQTPTPKPALATPTLSPDGSEIAFASGGDIWTVPAAGGTARLLVTDPATEDRPIYSPDGRQMAFTSTRNGAPNIYVMTLATGQVRRLTWSDATEQLDAWSADGRWIYFSSGANDVARQTDVFRVAASGGTPLEVSRERFLAEFNSAPSPDGATVALIAKGNSGVQWWRNGHAHIDEGELWLKPVAAGAPYRRLLGPDAKHLWPMWSPDGATLYYMSDASGSENLWKLAAAGGQPTQITHFTAGRVLFPAIARDGSAIVFERDFGIWKLDLKSGQAAQVPIALRGAPASAGDRRLNETNFQQMALSPDGKKVAVVAHGEVFAAGAKDGGPAEQVTTAGGIQSDLVWSPDSRRVAYVALRGLDSHVRAYDFATRRERAITAGAGFDTAISWSPDGKTLAYVRDRKELRVVALNEAGEPGKDSLLFSGQIAGFGGSAPAWSPDGKWLAFAVTDTKSFRNVWVIPATGGEARPISFLANGDASTIVWSKDGKYIVFDTAQRSEDVHIVRVDLLPHVPRYREDEFRDLFRQPERTPTTAPNSTPPTAPGARPPQPASPPPKTEPEPAGEKAADAKTGEAKSDADKPAPAKPAAAPVKIVFDGIRERATYLPLGLSAEEPVISPDGKTLVFRSTLSGNSVLYSYNLDELVREPPTPQQLVSSRRAKRFVAFTPDSKSVYYLEGGLVGTTTIENSHPKFVAINAELEVTFDHEKVAAFDQAWSLLDRGFFDARFHGQDWKALRVRFTPYIEGAHTSDEMRRITNLMIGELNASHSGINRPPNGYGPARVADLGLRFDREAYEAGKGLVVREVITLGPAFIEGAIKPGDVLTAVDGHAIGPGVDLDQLMVDKAGKRTVLTIRTGSGTRQAVVRPVSAQVASGLLYRHWIDGRRAYVDKISGGRLGYVHIADMSSEALDQLYLDLDAQNEGKEGVVVDVRNNNGGFVNGYVLDVFTRRNYLTMTSRDQSPVPSRQALGQRALGVPTVLITNESSLSDAEDFTEGYRTLKLGKVVGVPTAGWIIYTSNIPLVDGSVVRVPSTRIQGAAGDDMELHPRPVDVTVERPLGETIAGKDAQLEAAVSELLKTLGPAPARR